VFAAGVCALQLQIVAQAVQQTAPRLDGDRQAHAVDYERDWDEAGHLLPGYRARNYDLWRSRRDTLRGIARSVVCVHRRDARGALVLDRGGAVSADAWNARQFRGASN